MIKSGTTPLKRAQAAYYGGNKNRSPLVVQPSRPVKRATVTQDSNKLPVHARLGNKSNVNGVASTGRINKKLPLKTTGIVTKNSNNSAVKQLIAQKRALRLQTIQQQKKLKQIEETLKRVSPFFCFVRIQTFL